VFSLAQWTELLIEFNNYRATRMCVGIRYHHTPPPDEINDSCLRWCIRHTEQDTHTHSCGSLLYGTCVNHPGATFRSIVQHLGPSSQLLDGVLWCPSFSTRLTATRRNLPCTHRTAITVCENGLQTLLKGLQDYVNSYGLWHQHDN